MQLVPCRKKPCAVCACTTSLRSTLGFQLHCIVAKERQEATGGAHATTPLICSASADAQSGTTASAG